MAIILLVLCALLDFGVAALHVVVMFMGARGYRAFGAGETIARWAEEGSLLPTLIALGITAVFLGFAAYVLAVAGWLALPHARLTVIGIAAIYTLRGALLAGLLIVPDKLSRFDVVSSIISLAIGLLHFAALAAGAAS
jgi:hypothetical protein